MRKFDLFPKISDESFDVRTTMGGLISIVTFIFMGLIIFVESRTYTNVTYKQQAFFEDTALRTQPPMVISFNMTIAYPCQLLHFCVEDTTGNHQLDSAQKISRQRLDNHFKPIGPIIADQDPKSVMSSCGNCLGSNYTKCCLTCFDIATSFQLQNRLVPNLDNVDQCTRDKKSIDDGETCRIVGDISTQLSRGEMLINPGGEIHTPVHYKNDLSYFGDNVNLSHWIDYIHFGPKVEGITNPLENTHWKQQKRGFFAQRYTVNLVKTVSAGHGRDIETNQYSAFFSEKEITKAVSKKHPGLAFSFETAPIAVRVTKSSKTLSQLITSICAIIGGGFTIGGLADSFLFKINLKRN